MVHVLQSRVSEAGSTGGFKELLPQLFGRQSSKDLLQAEALYPEGSQTVNCGRSTNASNGTEGTRRCGRVALHGDQHGCH